MSLVDHSWPPGHLKSTASSSDLIQPASADHSCPPGHLIVYSRLLIWDNRLSLLTASLLAISLSTCFLPAPASHSWSPGHLIVYSWPPGHLIVYSWCILT